MSILVKRAEEKDAGNSWEERLSHWRDAEREAQSETHVSRSRASKLFGRTSFWNPNHKL